MSATVNLASVSGTWRDADGNTGPFVFNPPGVGGSPRPEPTRSALITSAQLASSIFAGTGSATTISRSDHTHDDRYYTRSQADALVEAAVLGASEMIATPGRLIPILLNEFGQSGSTAETVSSTTTGRWLVSKTFRGHLTCPSAIPIFFLMIDGAPVVSSAIPFVSGQSDGVTLVGATTGPISAGAHIVAVGGDCPGQAASQNGLFGATAASVTVLR